MSFTKYKYLITYRLAEIIFDLVDQFVLKYLSQLNYLSLKDQILKTARSIKQNICHQLLYLLACQIKAIKTKFLIQSGYTKNLYKKRKLLSLTKSLKLSTAFTLLEILIIIAVVALLATAVLVLFNPKKQIEKAWDSKRKHELAQLKKVLEDWYNDKNCYPRPNEICYNSVGPNNTCYICGNHRNSPSFSPYFNSLPCDPESPRKNYLYQVDNINCPTWYRIYADLSISNFSFNEEATKEIECFYQSCGPGPRYGYDYGISSPNIDLERNTNNFSYCAIRGCNFCGTYQQCLNILQNNPQLLCNREIIIMPVNNCGKHNCPCQPY